MPRMSEHNPIFDELIERLNELEIRYVYQVRLLEELNEVVTENGRRLDSLERENRRLRETVARLAPEPLESPDE